MSTHSLRQAVILCAALFVGTIVSACASAPVQEMSDARQAIRAAQNAGASQKATAQFQSAQALMTSAEQSLQKRLYRAAKRDAVAARNRAVEAMQAASGHEGSPPGISR